MALQSQAQLLDELMGKNRNSGPGARINSIRFDDEDVCKYMLCGFCPHDLFVNTRADLGPCDKIHDEELRKQYEKSSRFGRLGFEDDFERFIRSLLNDVERKIRRGVERLKLTQSDNAGQKNPIQIKQERVAELKEEINKLIKEAEHLGEEGKIEEAQTIVAEIDKLKSECKYLENQIELALHNAEQKQMEVCEVCGSFLIVNDAQSRVEEHISGKQHMGYAKLKAALDEIKKKRMEEYEKREKERKNRSSTDRDRDRDRNGSRRDRSRDRDRRDRDRSRDRDRNRDRDRDRERNRDRDRDRDRERDRDRKSSRSPSSSKKLNGSSKKDSRERDRERERDSQKRHRTRSRSRSRDRKHHKNGNDTNSNNNDSLKSTRSSKEPEDKRKNDEKSRKLEEETNEFLKIVDNLNTGKDVKAKKIKRVKRKPDEEKEEGEEDEYEEVEVDDEEEIEENGKNGETSSSTEK